MKILAPNPQTLRATREKSQRQNAKRNPFRRAIRHEASLPDGIQLFSMKSASRAEVRHEPSVDLQTREVICTCEDFRFRRVKNAPLSIDNPASHCKHLVRAVALLERRAAFPAPAERFCHVCGCVESCTSRLFPMCNDDGAPIRDANICEMCANAGDQSPDEYDLCLVPHPRVAGEYFVFSRFDKGATIPRGFRCCGDAEMNIEDALDEMGFGDDEPLEWDEDAPVYGYE